MGVMYSCTAGAPISVHEIDGATGVPRAATPGPFLQFTWSLAFAPWQPSGRFLHAGIRVGSAAPTTAIATFRIDAQGAWERVDDVPVPTLDPVAMVVDRRGRFLYLAERGRWTGSDFDVQRIAVFALDPATGGVVAANVRYYDLRVYDLAISPSGRYLYATGGGGIFAFRLDEASGALSPLPGSPFFGVTPGAGDVVASDRFLVAVGADADGFVGIDLHRLDPDTGVLRYGDHLPATSLAPRIALGAHGRYVYAVGPDPETSDGRGIAVIDAYAIDEATVRLRAIPGGPWLAGHAPWSAVVEPSGRFLYVGHNQFGEGVRGYRIDPATGALAPLPGSPFMAQPGCALHLAVTP
jgi:6-phosphogluconolactonase (cycloisomerase 2 family)